MRAVTKQRLKLLLIILLAVSVALLAWPREDRALAWLGFERAELSVRRGLDLQGGVSLTYQAQIPKGADTGDVMDRTVRVIERRVNPGGVSEAIVQAAENNRIVVQLPGEEDPQAARELIGRTAQLSFWEIPAARGGNVSLAPTNISGEDVDNAQVDIISQTNQVTVSLQMKDGESTREFADLTTRLNQEGGQLVILLDQQVVFGPAPVSSPITTGQASLTGVQSIDEATEIAQLINAGALPVPIELVASRTIGPSLGVESLTRSLVAAMIGLFSLVAFLILRYRVGGAVAVAVIAMYGATLVAIFKLSNFTEPYVVVLTLAGIAGTILSIAVAADFNILILERIREERQAGATNAKAVESGYRHASSSIRDAATATIISTVILYSFGSPEVRGFALTLGIGVALSVIFAAAVTKNLLRALARGRWGGQL